MAWDVSDRRRGVGDRGDPEGRFEDRGAVRVESTIVVAELHHVGDRSRDGEADKAGAKGSALEDVGRSLASRYSAAVVDEEVTAISKALVVGRKVSASEDRGREFTCGKRGLDYVLRHQPTKGAGLASLWNMMVLSFIS